VGIFELAATAAPDLAYSHSERYPDGITLEQATVKVIGATPQWAIARGLRDFFHNRLKVFLRDQGIRHDIIDACIAMPGNDDLARLVKRATALSETLKTEDGENLIQGFKRANNILSQAEDADGVEYSYGAEVKYAETHAERALFTALDSAEADIAPALAQQDYASAMHAMASLRAPIDAFFDAVQINTDNAMVRRNRLNLLSRIRTLCLSVADLRKIEGCSVFILLKKLRGKAKGLGAEPLLAEGNVRATGQWVKC
jgi:glycyl-tRNA synthetase beta chain